MHHCDVKTLKKFSEKDKGTDPYPNRPGARRLGLQHVRPLGNNYRPIPLQESIQFLIRIKGNSNANFHKFVPCKGHTVIPKANKLVQYIQEQTQTFHRIQTILPEMLFLKSFKIHCNIAYIK